MVKPKSADNYVGRPNNRTPSKTCTTLAACTCQRLFMRQRCRSQSRRAAQAPWHVMNALPPTVQQNQLENVAINDVLPLKAVRRDAIANLKCFGASDTRDLISMVTFTFTMGRHLIRLASAPFISSRLATFGCVRFPCATRGKHAEFTKGG